MNYAELTAAIEDYTQNTFTATDLATFVSQAEQRIYNTIQFANLRKNVINICLHHLIFYQYIR